MTLNRDTGIISKRELTETKSFQDSTASQSKEGQQKLSRQADQRQNLTKRPGFLKKIIGIPVIYSIVILQRVLSNYYIIFTVWGTGNNIEKWDRVTDLFMVYWSMGEGKGNSRTHTIYIVFGEKVVNLVLYSWCLRYV